MELVGVSIHVMLVWVPENNSEVVQSRKRYRIIGSSNLISLDAVVGSISYYSSYPLIIFVKCLK